MSRADLAYHLKSILFSSVQRRDNIERPGKLHVRELTSRLFRGGGLVHWPIKFRRKAPLLIHWALEDSWEFDGLGRELAREHHGCNIESEQHPKTG